MDYPSITTILIGLAVMTSVLGIDWFVWGRTYTANLRRPRAQGSQRERHEFPEPSWPAAVIRARGTDSVRPTQSAFLAAYDFG
jgi:hypothetical protein